MIYQIYKTTNLINGKIYIGQHSCSCKECSYMGSGKNIIKAIRKYGAKNFKKEILFSFDTFEEMNEKESELVNEEFTARKDTYNLMTGGGASGIPGKEAREKMSNYAKNRKIEHNEKISLYNSNRTDDHKQKLAESLKGKNPSVEARKKMSEKAKLQFHSKERREKVSIANKNRSKELIISIAEKNRGQKRSKEFCERQSVIASSVSEKTRKKMSISAKNISEEVKENRSLIQKQKQRISWGNKDLLKIDIHTNEIVGRYYYAADTGFVTSNIKQGIKKGKPRYGYKWRMDA